MCVARFVLSGDHLSVLFLEPGCGSSPPPAAVWLVAERLVPALLLEPEGSAADRGSLASHRHCLRFFTVQGPPVVPVLDKLLHAARYLSAVRE